MLQIDASSMERVIDLYRGYYTMSEDIYIELVEPSSHFNEENFDDEANFYHVYIKTSYKELVALLITVWRSRC